MASPKPLDRGPWNPGLTSRLPSEFLPLSTVFRPDNVETELGQALELSDASGMPPEQLVLFRPERLVVHAVLIRVMADFSVPVGRVYADLGVNFRAMVATILREGIDAHSGEIADAVGEIRAEIDAVLDRELARALDAPAPKPAEPEARTWASLLGFGRSRQPAAAPPRTDPVTQILRSLERWQTESRQGGDALEIAACEALHGAVSGVLGRRPALVRDRAILHTIARILACNRHSGDQVGTMIEPWLQEVAARNGYHRLAPQKRPVVLNVKGASASGKSTIRPYQRALATRLGLDWSDFALITPDVWRKFLLDYDSLGPARMYAGTLTGHEVAIIDAKLDRHMAFKASCGQIPHLVIDRFRFDSFATDPASDGTGQLLTRFGDRVYLQFMVTPPAATVERAWKRGEMFGRYKAVEDLLAHNVEAYGGMPRLFFAWALRRDKSVFVEFLDNAVPEGSRPATIAFGADGVMTVLDPKAMLDIVRFQRIDIYARGPEDVLHEPERSTELHAGFLREALRRIPTMRFAERGSGRVYARFERGRLAVIDSAAITRLKADPDLAAIFAAIGIPEEAGDYEPANEILVRENEPTLGEWGTPGPDRPQQAA